MSPLQAYTELNTLTLKYSSFSHSTVTLFQFSQAQARTFKYNEYIIESKSGNSTCPPCRACPPGFGLIRECDTRIKDNETKNKFEPCVFGKTYSEDEDIGSCKPSGSQCKDTCSKGFYFEDLTGDCQPCSWCCSDGSNKVRSGCKEMPFYKQCDVNTAKNCKPKCQNGQYVVPTYILYLVSYTLYIDNPPNKFTI